MLVILSSGAFSSNSDHNCMLLWQLDERGGQFQTYKKGQTPGTRPRIYEAWRVWQALGETRTSANGKIDCLLNMQNHSQSEDNASFASASGKLNRVKTTLTQLPKTGKSIRFIRYLANARSCKILKWKYPLGRKQPY